MQDRTFTPSEDSSNRLERYAWFARLAGRGDLAEEAEEDFYHGGTEDDCCHEYAG